MSKYLLLRHLDTTRSEPDRYLSEARRFRRLQKSGTDHAASTGAWRKLKPQDCGAEAALVFRQV